MGAAQLDAANSARPTASARLRSIVQQEAAVRGVTLPPALAQQLEGDDDLSLALLEPVAAALGVGTGDLLARLDD